MIGVFDSGLGGLTVLREIHARLPTHDLLYLGDTAYLPYGTKSAGEVKERALWCGRFLERQGAKAVVIACHTASACALNLLRKELSIPVIGVIEPFIADCTLTRVGLLATPRTIASGVYQRSFDIRCAVAAPELVEMVEGDWEDSEEIVNILHPIKAAEIDALILGCTHFPLLKESIARELGGIPLLDSGMACASELQYLIEPGIEEGKISYSLTAPSPTFIQRAEQLLPPAAIAG